MARVLMIGLDPEQVDFTDPALPPGMDAAMIRHGIAVALEGLRSAGHAPTQFFIPADPGELGQLDDYLAAEPTDCVVIGGGVRLPPRNLALFEAVVNLIARAPHGPAIGLISRPEEAAAAVARVLGDRAGHRASS